ncbi:hypothetical protein IV203_034870 [Nitzschia inconspicua]|uniref:Uncharacterized protein n=1 Tax=Nitzschia inconspicua TaxID=303405 RepID=A0A9K3PU27_9STRA|nr:hypothetical protein IV203_034870 [Nitzschia inconspicua]
MMFLGIVAKSYGRVLKGGIPDKVGAARAVLNDWNHGKIPYYIVPPRDAEPDMSKGGAVIVSSCGVRPTQESKVLANYLSGKGDDSDEDMVDNDDADDDDDKMEEENDAIRYKLAQAEDFDFSTMQRISAREMVSTVLST